MSRCRACDQLLHKTEMFWRREEQRWEDLCSRCRSAVYKSDQENSEDVFGFDFEIKAQINDNDFFGGGGDGGGII